MSKSSSVYTGVTAMLKEQPDEVKFRAPLDYSMMSQGQFHIEIERGLADLNAGRTMSSKQVRENMQRKYRA